MCPNSGDKDDYLTYDIFVSAQRPVWISHGVIGVVDLTFLVVQAFL